MTGNELRFTDSAFTCEVVLAGPAKALYEKNQPQFKRLKGIKCLGLASHISDISMHTRHHHLVGLMRIFNKLCDQPEGKGLSKKFLWSFWCRLCFGQTGHAALSYDSEKAILLAAHLDPTFKAKVHTLLQPLIDRLSKCPVCSKKQCPIKDKDSADATEWFEDLVRQNLWPRVHFWIAALKLIQTPRVLSILGQQVSNEDDKLGFSEPEALKMLTSPECLWNHALSRLNSLDYVVRDLAFAGTLGIQVDVDGLIASVNQSHSDWELLESVGRYLKRTLYENNEAQTASALFQRALADLLLSGKISLEELFGIDPNLAIDDDKLAKLLQKFKSGREVFDPKLRATWHTWPISCFVDPKRIPCEVEKAITGQTKMHLSSHTRTRVTCLKLEQKHSIGLAMCYSTRDKRPTAKSFIKLCRSALLRHYPQLTSKHLTTALYEGLVDRACEHNLEATVKRYANLPIPREILQGAAGYITKRSAIAAPEPTDVRIVIGGFEYPLPTTPVTIMHAAIMGGDAVCKNLGLSQSDAAEILWSQILEWQSVYFGSRPTKGILKLLEETQSLLAQSVVTAGGTAQTDLELYTMLEALKHPSQSVSFRMVLPNLKLLKEDKTPENEYDVVSVVLKEDKHVEVWIWGVTTEADITTKKNEDRAKIQKLKDHLGRRWGGEITTVENYVHKDGYDICCEIQGRQEQRRIT